MRSSLCSIKLVGMISSTERRIQKPKDSLCHFATENIQFIPQDGKQTENFLVRFPIVCQIHFLRLVHWVWLRYVDIVGEGPEARVLKQSLDEQQALLAREFAIAMRRSK